MPYDGISDDERNKYWTADGLLPTPAANMGNHIALMVQMVQPPR